jgi:hypothetical protein
MELPLNDIKVKAENGEKNKFFVFIHIFISMDIHKTCKICNIEKPINYFYKSQRGSRCIECTLNINKEGKKKNRLNPEFRKKESIKQKERRIRLWQNTLIHDSKHRNLNHDLTVADINEMYEKQNGLCYWFKVPLIPSNKNKHPQQPSIDRLDRNKGYTKDNVVLSCYSANIGRNDTDLFTWTEFLKLLK